ncbi:hypothetical protein COOONC_16218 [Cooperia oncophora]
MPTRVVRQHYNLQTISIRGYPSRKQVDSVGAIFVNRDGDLFAHALQFMRDGKRTAMPQNAEILRQLVRESEFFGMDVWNSVLQQRLADAEERENKVGEVCLIAGGLKQHCAPYHLLGVGGWKDHAQSVLFVWAETVTLPTFVVYALLLLTVL